MRERVRSLTLEVTYGVDVNVKIKFTHPFLNDYLWFFMRCLWAVLGHLEQKTQILLQDKSFR